MLTLQLTLVSSHAADSPINNVKLIYITIVAIFKKVGDMTFIKTPGSAKRSRRNAINNPNALWPNGVIPYQIASTFNGK